jgi:hypothetical protein
MLYLERGTKVNHEKPQGGWAKGRDLDPRPSEYEAGMLPTLAATTAQRLSCEPNALVAQLL